MVPLVNPKERTTHLRGTVLLKDNAFSPGIRHEWVELRYGDKMVGRVRTNENGEFEFNQQVPNGFYALRVNSPKYQGNLLFEIKSYQMQNLRIFVENTRLPAGHR